MRFGKEVLKSSFLYRNLAFSKALFQAKRWTPRDQRMREFYSQFLSLDDLCFDVGSNIGNRVKIFLELKARVVAIEPQEFCNKVVQTAFGRNPRLTVLQKVLGEKPGEGELLIGEANTLSTLSRDWVKAVQESGRFTEFLWARTHNVQMTTLDELIGAYGVPAFIKIDVEGYEYEVIKGLSRPIRAISLEFTPEYVESTLSCIDRLAELGDIRLNYSLGEEMRLRLNSWVTITEMKGILSGFGANTQIFGDVYVRSPV
jgi:FkbM family methyltransferase